MCFARWGGASPTVSATTSISRVRPWEESCWSSPSLFARFAAEANASRFGLASNAKKRSLFGRALQASQRLYRPSHEEATEQPGDQSTPPPWRELESSSECHARGMPIQRHNLDDFIVDDRKRQMNAKRKVSRSRRFPNVEHDPHPVTRSGTQH